VRHAAKCSPKTKPFEGTETSTTCHWGNEKCQKTPAAQNVAKRCPKRRSTATSQMQYARKRHLPKQGTISSARSAKVVLDSSSSRSQSREMSHRRNRIFIHSKRKVNIHGKKTQGGKQNWELDGIVRSEPESKIFVPMDTMKHLDPQHLVKILLPQLRESRSATQA